MGNKSPFYTKAKFPWYYADAEMLARVHPNATPRVQPAERCKDRCERTKPNGRQCFNSARAASTTCAMHGGNLDKVPTIDVNDEGALRAGLKQIGLPAEQIENEVRRARWSKKLAVEQPGLPPITALIMAGDFASAETWEAEARAGKITWEEAVNLTGSYARFWQAIRLHGKGLLPDKWVFKHLPELWRGADPDDTDPDFIAVWRAAFDANNGRYLSDGKKLPGRPLTVKVYRGQPKGAPVGLSWSLSRATAEKFAKGAWARQAVDDGCVYVAEVPTEFVLAYITGRGEEEVIIDPRYFDDADWAFERRSEFQDIPPRATRG